MTMIMVNIFEAKAKLSDLIERATAGERILICKRNQPIAELRPVAASRQSPRPIGKARGTLTIPSTFFEPLDAVDLEAFDAGTVYPPTQSTASRVAEHPAGRPAPAGRRGGRSSKRR